ncbi:hypothetical protein BsWGS_15369 [Bradybaena similaris]
MPLVSAMSSSLHYDSELPGYAQMEAAAGMYGDPHRGIGGHSLSHAGLNHTSPALHQPYPNPYSTSSTTMPGVMMGSQDSQMKRDKDSIYS